MEAVLRSAGFIRGMRGLFWTALALLSTPAEAGFMVDPGYCADQFVRSINSSVTPVADFLVATADRVKSEGDFFISEFHGKEQLLSASVALEAARRAHNIASNLPAEAKSELVRLWEMHLRAAADEWRLVEARVGCGMMDQVRSLGSDVGYLAFIPGVQHDPRIGELIFGAPIATTIMGGVGLAYDTLTLAPALARRYNPLRVSRGYFVSREARSAKRHFVKEVARYDGRGTMGEGGAGYRED